MNCKQIKNKLFFLADGSLNKDEEILLRKHLEQCPDCLKQYELFSVFENILQEEKSISSDDYFYTRLVSRMEGMNTPAVEKTNLRPAWLNLANIFVITIIIGIALFSGITFAERNYKYLGSSKEIQQANNQQNDIAVGQDQLTSNFSEY